MYSDGRKYNTENNNVNQLQNNFNSFNIKTNNIDDHKKLTNKDFYVPEDVIEYYFNYLPTFIKEDLVNGPVSRCENAECRNPVFDFVHYEFTMG